MAAAKPTINEVDFCAQVASAANQLIGENPTAFPFHEARIEGYGTGAGRKKRKDLRFFKRDGKVELCGEVRLPAPQKGHSPFDAELCASAAAKAENAGCRYFFTWNVNQFVLWDRSLWDQPLLDRRVWQKQLGRTFASAEDVAREDNLTFVKTHFLPDLLKDLADIIAGRRREWLPPDDLFIRSLESHLDWPVGLTSTYLREQCRAKKAFDLRIQEWMTSQDWTFVRTPEEEWIKSLDNVAKTLCYVWANRLIFYKALRARFGDLPRLELKSSVRSPEQALTGFNELFRKAVDRSGDYEPLMMPDAKDWATGLVFKADMALDAWRGFLRGIESVDFRQVPSDIVGRIFQKLIGADERHRYGQHFTGDDVVDLINCFCVRRGSDAVLDPACGSGSFLVRAYYRKRQLDRSRAHLDVLSELFGCDISMYPAHLATLNLAAREINEEANYPRIVRKNFFDFDHIKPFCTIPGTNGKDQPVVLPELDAVVGNPPYVRQEKVERTDKLQYGLSATESWPDLKLSGRSDLHCYFWPAATRLLKAEGYFGFLTSSSWLDVEYGFALQGWVLRHFKILAIMESAAEPWFEDARVKTCVTILQHCDNEEQRMSNTVRFVRFNRRLADIINAPATEDESRRQSAVESLRKRILAANTEFHTADWRVVVKSQRDLWNDGVRAGAILRIDHSSASEESEDDDEEESSGEQIEFLEGVAGAYAAGKWGRYVRAPDIYFEIMRRFADRFVALGEIAHIRFGVKTGCDKFFMPKDVTQEMLDRFMDEGEFSGRTGGAIRKEVKAGKVKIIEAGDGSVHPIESRYVAPEVHSLMKVDRPLVRAADLDRVVLLVSEPLEKLKAKAPWAWRYLKFGKNATFTSTKSKPVPVPERSTCAARDPWYDLTGLVKPGFSFWPKAQQYRHIIPANPDRIICNCNLYDVASEILSRREQICLSAILNSTLVGLFKTFYGRFAGTEGNLKTEVVDVTLLEVPDPRIATDQVAEKLERSLLSMCERDVGRLVEEQLMDCHSPERARRLAAAPVVLSNELQQPDRRELDDAVLELLGVSDANERIELLASLYEATAKHFRDIRVVEIEKMEQRARSENRRFTVHDLAADIWDAAEFEDAKPLGEWVSEQPESVVAIVIPDEQPAQVSTDVMFSPNIVFFGRGRRTGVEFTTRGQAELVARLANVGVTGQLKIPLELEPSFKLLDRVDRRLERARARFQELAESRTGDERIRMQLLDVLQRWYAVGRTNSSSSP